MPRAAALAVIHLHPAAPAKPLAGQACNGCGVCCAWQPCPLGVLVTGRRHGACAALRWDDGAAPRYRCAVVSDPAAVWPRLPEALHPALQALARRWIASGAGCDCDAEVEIGAASGPAGTPLACPPPPPAAPARASPVRRADGLF